MEEPITYIVDGCFKAESRVTLQGIKKAWGDDNLDTYECVSLKI